MMTLLTPYQKLIDAKILSALPTFGQKNRLVEACEYALLNGGKRFRPALAFMTAKALKKNLDVSEAALAIEFFHTSSLVADDLPCMDDDDERRNKPSLHKIYGEAMTLLVSYALIAAGYECIAKNAQVLKNSGNKQSDHICVLALQNSTHNTGFAGATGGQFLDIFPPNLELETILEVIHKKTVSLFEISFVFGWLFGGGEIGQLDHVKKAASHFGIAFQIADDLGDVEQDAKNGRAINLAAILGFDKALEMFHEEIRLFKKSLQLLEIDSEEFLALADTLARSGVLRA